MSVGSPRKCRVETPAMMSSAACSVDEPIRVLSLCQVAGAGGGADRIVLQTAAQADPAEARFTVCCLRSDHDVSFDMTVRADHLGVKLIEIPDQRKYDRSVVSLLVSLVKENNIQIVHAHGYKPVFYAHQLAKRSNVTPIATLHGWTGHTWRERLLYYPLERILVRRFPAVVAVSSQIRDTLVCWGADPKKVAVLLNGVNITPNVPQPSTIAALRASLRVGAGDFLIGASGRLARQKRFDVLLRSVRVIMDKYPHVRLAIAGDGSLRAALERQASRLGIYHACRFLGHRDDMATVYRTFDLLVQSSDYEGTPTVIVEAMAAEAPIVATDVGGTSELVDHKIHALIVPRRNVTALSSAIEDVIRNPAAARQRAQRALKRVQTELSFTSRTKKLIAIYRQLVSRLNVAVRDASISA